MPAILNAIATSCLISVHGSASQIAGFDFSALTAPSVEVTLTGLDQDLTLSAANLSDLNLATLAVANDAIGVSAVAGGTRIDLTGTDGLAHTILIQGVSPSALTVYDPLDNGTALGAHGSQISDGVDVAAAIAAASPTDVTDTAAAIAANLDALQANSANITAIGFSDAAAPVLAVTEAQLTADAGILAKLSGDYTVAVNHVAAADATALAADTDITSVSVSDTATNILDNLDALEHVYRAGELASVNVAAGSLGTISEAQLFTDADVLRLIEQGSSEAVAARTGAGSLSFYAAPTHAAFETMRGFDALTDYIHTDAAVVGMDAAQSGRLSNATFASDLAHMHLDAGHAALFTATSGTLKGDVFLIVDANGQAGYQAGSDLVLDVTGGTHLDDLTALTFK